MATEPLSTVHTWVEELARQLADEVAQQAEGACTRVDGLSEAHSRAAVQWLRNFRPDGDLTAVVLAAAGDGDTSISVAQAVERRNEKRGRLVLFVPAGLHLPAASSLNNAFAAVNLAERLDQLVRRRAAYIGGDVGAAVQKLVTRRSRWDKLTWPVERHLDFVDIVLADPSWDSVGHNLWSIGLVPDHGGPSLMERRDRNREAVALLVHPARPQMSVGERVASLQLEDVTRAPLTRFLSAQRITNPFEWLQQLASQSDLTFDQWRFQSQATADLTEIVLEPFVDKNGAVQKYCQLKQGEPGQQLVGYVGPKAKVVVKWKTKPTTPAGVDGWRVDLVAVDGDEVDVVLPSKVIRKAALRQAPLSLNISLEEPIQVQAQVTPLNASGLSLEGNVPHALSEDFFLSPSEGDLVDPVSAARPTVSTLPLAGLTVALQAKRDAEGATRVSAMAPIEGPLWYFPFQFGSTVMRIAHNPTLLRVEECQLASPLATSPWSAQIDATGRLRFADMVRPGEAMVSESLATEWRRFLRGRELLFRLVADQCAGHPSLSLCPWSAEMSHAVERYGADFVKLLRSAMMSPRDVAVLLQMDTVQVRMMGDEGHVTLVLPTHPLRAVWYGQYAKKLGEWEQAVRDSGRKDISVASVERILPINTPAFCLGAAGEFHVFLDNLSVMWGVYVAPDCADPAGVKATLENALGFPERPEGATSSEAQRLAGVMQEFFSTYPWLPGWRIQAVHPGRGELLASAAHHAGFPADPKAEPSWRLPRLDIRVQDSAAPDLSSVVSLQRTLEAEGLTAGSDWLRPTLTFGGTDAGEAHLAVLHDVQKPKFITMTSDPEEPEPMAGLGGLLCRLWEEPVPDDGSGIMRWRYRPAVGTGESDLVALHQVWGQALAQVHGAPAGHLLALELKMGPEEIRRMDALHAATQWVVAVDRYAAIDLYDRPTDASVGGLADRYLVDYAPDFVEGYGHRVVVTTSWVEELLAKLDRAKRALRMDNTEEAIVLLRALKGLSGRLVLSVRNDQASAEGAVLLAATWRSQSEQKWASGRIAIPLAVHPQLLEPLGGTTAVDPLEVCDLLLVGLHRDRFEATFVSVGASGLGPDNSEGDLDDCMQALLRRSDASRTRFQQLFFANQPRGDQELQRNHLAAVLRFYLGRAVRYGVLGPQDVKRYRAAIERLEQASVAFESRLHVCVWTDAEEREGEFGEADRAGYSILRARRRQADPVPVPGQGNGGADVGTSIGPKRSASSSDEPGREEPLTPRAGLSPEGVYLPIGVAGAAMKPFAWRPSVKGSPHLLILGLPGQGKSVLMHTLLTTLNAAGVPSLTVDFAGDLSSNAGFSARVLDASRGLDFSPLEDAGDNIAQTCYMLAEIMAVTSGLGDIQKNLVYEALDHEYRAAQRAGRAPTLAGLNQQIGALPATGKVSHKDVGKILYRLTPIVKMGLFNETASQDSSPLAFKQPPTNSYFLDFHSVELDDMKTAAVAFLLRRLYKAAPQWGQSDVIRFAVAVDEAHRIAKDPTLPLILKELRKYGIMVIVASQNLGDFNPSILTNVGAMAVFRLNFPESKSAAQRLDAKNASTLAGQIENLGVGEMMTLADDRKRPVVVKVQAPGE